MLAYSQDFITFGLGLMITFEELAIVSISSCFKSVYGIDEEEYEELVKHLT